MDKFPPLISYFLSMYRVIGIRKLNYPQNEAYSSPHAIVLSQEKVQEICPCFENPNKGLLMALNESGKLNAKLLVR